MMKKSGYPGHLAAAIEAVASTGGQIMPPVMGIAAFLIADFLSIPYADVAIAAAPRRSDLSSFDNIVVLLKSMSRFLVFKFVVVSRPASSKGTKACQLQHLGMG